jgi:hypothetical protein
MSDLATAYAKVSHNRRAPLGTCKPGYPFHSFFWDESCVSIACDWQNKDLESCFVRHQAALDVAKQPNSGVEYTHLTALNKNCATVGRSIDQSQDRRVDNSTTT